MGASTECFKDFSFVMEHYNEYRFITTGDIDVLYGNRVHNEIDNVLVKKGIEGWSDLIPYLHDWYLDGLSSDDMNTLQKMLSYQSIKGMEFIKSRRVLDTIKSEMPERVVYLESLINRWKEGYYLLFDY